MFLTVSYIDKETTVWKKYNVSTRGCLHTRDYLYGELLRNFEKNVASYVSSSVLYLTSKFHRCNYFDDLLN